MVYCPPFLKKIFSQQNLPAGRQGFSITELLIVVAFLAILMVILLVALNPASQLSKARDARRKSDLNKIHNLVEDYYNDHNCYPSSLDPTGSELVPDYIDRVPTDPVTKEAYVYYPDGCDKYRIYVTLEYKDDRSIVEAGCQNGCGPGGDSGRCAHNYGISSSNTNLEGCTAQQPTPSPTGEPSCEQYACQQGYCNKVDPAVCLPKYCTSNCDNQCAREGGSEVGCP